jgi:hypothetical protein
MLNSDYYAEYHGITTQGWGVNDYMLSNHMLFVTYAEYKPLTKAV